MESARRSEKMSPRRKRIVDELIRGREFSNKLRLLLADPTNNGGSVSATDLADKILGSLTETISILSSSESDEASEFLGDAGASSQCWSGQKSEDSGESCKTPAPKDRRGCYKRRKTSTTWEIVTPTSVDDGHAWRKYGQKVILKTKYPRNYFRCTHKFDQGCQATKQVQKTEDDPPMYRTTYHGHHTCKVPLKASQIFLNSSTTEEDSSLLLSFGSNGHHNTTTTKENNSFSDSFPSMKMKQERVPTVDRYPLWPPPTSDYLPSPDLTVLESSGPTTAMSSGSDHGDVISSGVYSCTASTLELDMDIMVESVDFDMFDY